VYRGGERWTSSVAHPRPCAYACGRTLVARSSKQTMIGGGGMTARSSNGETPFSVKFPADPGEDTENHYLSRLPPAAGYLPDPH
jgi:hypothetical protein